MPISPIETATAIRELVRGIVGSASLGQMSTIADGAVQTHENIDDGTAHTMSGIYQLESTLSNKADLVDGKLNTSQLPDLSITNTFVAANQDEMLALSTAEVGDVAIRTDISKSFILKTDGYSTLANWQELLSPSRQCRA